MSKYIDCKEKYDVNDLNEAALCIKNGGLVLFPTETVYGLGADGLNSIAVKNIFIAKGRKQDNPLILHISNKEMISRIARDITPLEQKLIDKFFPGPFTLILKKSNIVPDVVSANLDTVGIRMPTNKIAHDLIELSDTPIAAPSANISGKPSGTNVNDIFDELGDKVDYIIDGGQTDIGVESTVVRVIDNTIHILRPGKITKDDLLEVCNNVIIDSHVLGDIKEGEKILSPGMKYRHYAPNSKCLLIYTDNDKKFIDKVNLLKKENNKILVLCRNHLCNNFDYSIPLGESLEDISKNIFSDLRKVDDYDANLVVIEGVPSDGLGLAIMNRLIRACSHNYIEL